MQPDTSPPHHSNARRRWPAVPAVCLLAAVLAGAAGASPVASHATPACAAATLVVWLNTESGGAAAGSTYTNLELTNLSGRACTLRGYPRVTGVDLRGRQLGSPAGQNPSSPVRTVRLLPGASAVAVLQIADALNYPPATCRRRSAAGLRVRPPGQARAKEVPFPFVACSRAGPAYLHVAPVRHA